MTEENLIPAPAETVRRAVQGSVQEARNLREKGYNAYAESVQESASVALQNVEQADGEFISLPESDLTTLTSSVPADTSSEIWNARNNLITFRENQHEKHE
jgi:hypothetical protein